MNENVMGLDEYRGMAKRRAHPEKDLMRVLMRTAWTLDFPCVHIENYCGKRYNHRCAKCGAVSLVTCHGRNNIDNVGHYDILGIAWAIETKTVENPALRLTQKATAGVYERYGIPHIVLNEKNADSAISFFRGLRA